MPQSHRAQHNAQSSITRLLPPGPDLLRVGSRRWFLQTGLAGLAGLTLADTLRLQAAPSVSRDPKAVILFWLSGGPSQIDTWDPKPDAPPEIRGPYRTMATRVPGVRFCEHLPLQASIMDRLTILRAVDCSASNHTPITMQAGNPLARRTDDGRDGAGYPSMGSVAARFRGANAPGMPAFVGLAPSWRADVWGAGAMGTAYEPVNGVELPGRLAMPAGCDVPRLQDRADLRRRFDTMRRDLDAAANAERMDRNGAMALDIVTSPRVREAFNIDKEPETLRDRYGRCSVGEKALLARRLVEAGTTFVLVSGRWGYFDHHGDTVPPWGGILRGLTPILPTVDRALFARPVVVIGLGRFSGFGDGCGLGVGGGAGGGSAHRAQQPGDAQQGQQHGGNLPQERLAGKMLGEELDRLIGAFQGKNMARALQLDQPRAGDDRGDPPRSARRHDAIVVAGDHQGRGL